ncbi:uncharacterized protein LOC117099879 [Anneissia japonica]|uniref:uncharacterized protein LOC117099879 n=1 Tax=Anneissia japonica TaxID=1529436 RepID=UPI00142560F3|nr:uncharacterized protein LOC117099879 [Anneissia japonica]
MSHEMGSSVDEAGPSNISSSVTERLPDSGFSGTTDENQFRAPQDSQENKTPESAIHLQLPGPQDPQESVTQANKFVDASLEVVDELRNYKTSGMKAEAEILATPLNVSMADEVGTSVDEARLLDNTSSIAERFLEECLEEDDDEFEVANGIALSMKSMAERTAISLRSSMADETGAFPDEARQPIISSSIIHNFEIPLSMTENERRAFGDLLQSVVSFDDRMSQRFLLHCTSSNLPLQPIRINFEAVRRGSARAFTADTHYNVLFLPTTYESYKEFEAEFKRIIRRNTRWF